MAGRRTGLLTSSKDDVNLRASLQRIDDPRRGQSQRKTAGEKEEGGSETVNRGASAAPDSARECWLELSTFMP